MYLCRNNFTHISGSKIIIGVCFFVLVRSGIRVCYDDKKVDVTINSVGGQLVVIAAEKITHIEVYSAIGGLLYSAKPNYSEVRIDNLPKTFLVVRLRFANKTTAIYKIKKD